MSVQHSPVGHGKLKPGGLTKLNHNAPGPLPMPAAGSPVPPASTPAPSLSIASSQPYRPALVRTNSDQVQ